MTSMNRPQRGVVVYPLLAASFLAAPPTTMAGGLQLYEVGTADVGLASAGYAARAQDAATVLTNPAGMVRLPGTQLLLGAQALHADLKFSPNGGTSPALGDDDGGNPVGWMPGGGLFVTHRISPELTVGFAATGNFGLALKYDEEWVGRYRVQEATLMAASLLPSVAYRATEQLSLGASLNAAYGILDNRVGINRIGAGPDGKLELEDKVWGLGVNLGLLHEISPATRIGVTYNSEVKLDFSPDAKLSGEGPLLRALLQSRGLLDATEDLGVYIPQGVNAGLFHQLNARWAVLGSVGWQDWSRFGKIEVSIDDSANPTSTTVDLDFKDTWQLALGAQYRPNDAWLLNFGVAYDSEFQDSSEIGPTLPANDGWRFGIGLQNQSARDFEWGVAAAYVYGGSVDVDQQGRDPATGGRGDLVGSYSPRMIFLSANFIWKF